MTSLQPPVPPAPGSGDLQVQIGSDGVKVVKNGTDPVLTQQAQMLKARVQSLTKEIDAVKAEMNAPGSAPSMPSNQVRLTGLESRRIDAEEALQQVEDQLAGLSDQRALTTEVGVPAGLPEVPFDPNQSALQERVAMIAMAAIVCIGMPIAIAIARSIWRRTTARTLPSVSTEDARRLERVEQAVDTIAVEMERLSEGQRYVTKLLAERGPRVGEPVAAPLARGTHDDTRRSTAS